MSVTRPWGRLSDHDLEFASTDSAMGHAADLALGIALARPDRTVVCLNGDGSMLMALGTLATAVGARAENFVLIVVDNGVYEITGNQPVAASGSIDYAAMAVAAGFPRVFRFDDAREYVEAVPSILERSPEAPGPTLVHVRVEPGTEGPIRALLARVDRRVVAHAARRPRRESRLADSRYCPRGHIAPS